MLMMLGLAVAVDTGSTVVERPAADAHDAWWLSTLAMPRSSCLPLMLMMLGACHCWQCRGQAACR